MCSVQQEIVSGALVPVALQQALGLVTLANNCSATLLNRFWVLTADHCVAGGVFAGPDGPFSSVAVTATWSTRTVIPTRYVRFGVSSGLDVALMFLGAGDFGPANVQLFYLDQVETGDPVIKYGRGIYAFATGSGPTASPAKQDGIYRSAQFVPSSADAKRYTLPLNVAGQIANGGDSGGPDFRTAPNGIAIGISGVQSTCAATGYVPGKPANWTWATGISSCNSDAIYTIRDQVVRVIQEGRDPCPEVSANCAAVELSSRLLLLK